MGREVEIVPHVARRQVGVEDSDAEVFQALRVVRKVTDDAGEQADVGGVDVAAGNPCLTAASTTLKRPAQALKNGLSSRTICSAT